MATFLSTAAQKYRVGGDFKLASEKLLEALHLCPHECSMRAELLNNMGHVQVSMGMLDAAIPSFSESALIYGKIGNRLERGRQLGNIGSVHRDQRKYDEALLSYRQSIDSLQNEDDFIEIAYQYSNIAYIYAMSANAAEAVRWYGKAKKLYLETGKREQATMVGDNLEILTAGRRHKK